VPPVVCWDYRCLNLSPLLHQYRSSHLQRYLSLLVQRCFILLPLLLAAYSVYRCYSLSLPRVLLAAYLVYRCYSLSLLPVLLVAYLVYHCCSLPPAPVVVYLDYQF
jgi:hypothetical protein